MQPDENPKATNLAADELSRTEPGTVSCLHRKKIDALLPNTEFHTYKSVNSCKYVFV